MNTRNSQTFRKCIAIAVVLMLAVHGILCIYFAVTPRHYMLHASSVGSLYHRVFLIGPFFTEERITSSTQLYMRYKVKGGAWSEPVSYTDRVHREDASILSAYNDLKHDDLLRYFAKSYRPHKASVEKPDRKECILIRYSIHELIPLAQAVDSINLVFVHNTFFQKHNRDRSDTVWNVTLNPDRCVR